VAPVEAVLAILTGTGEALNTSLIQPTWRSPESATNVAEMSSGDAVPEPFIICHDHWYVLWLLGTDSPGSPPMTREALAAYLEDDATVSEPKVKVLLDRALLHETSDPDVTSEQVLSGAKRIKPRVSTLQDLIEWAKEP
jgi:hypothetical protein